MSAPFFNNADPSSAVTRRHVQASNELFDEQAIIQSQINSALQLSPGAYVQSNNEKVMGVHDRYVSSVVEDNHWEGIYGTSWDDLPGKVFANDMVRKARKEDIDG